MTRARQVANFDPALLAADEVSGDKVHGGTISGSPTLVTPDIGTPSAGVVTNLSGVLPVGVTGGSGLTALGTVTAGTIGAGVTQPKGIPKYITQKSISGAENFTFIHGTDGFIFDTTYDEYHIYFHNITNTSSKSFYAQIGISDGTIRTGSVYKWIVWRAIYDGSNAYWSITQGTNDFLHTNMSIQASSSASPVAKCTLRHMASSSLHTTGVFENWDLDSGFAGGSECFGKYPTAEANDRIKFMPNGSGGAWTLTATEYGVNYA